MITCSRFVGEFHHQALHSGHPAKKPRLYQEEEARNQVSGLFMKEVHKMMLATITMRYLGDQTFSLLGFLKRVSMRTTVMKMTILRSSMRIIIFRV